MANFINTMIVILIIVQLLFIIYKKSSTFAATEDCNNPRGNLPGEYLGITQAEKDKMLVDFVKNGNK